MSVLQRTGQTPGREWSILLAAGEESGGGDGRAMKDGFTEEVTLELRPDQWKGRGSSRNECRRPEMDGIFGE